MTFLQEAPPRLRFQHNPIKIVVAQLRFPRAYTLARTEVLAEIQSRLTGYPNALPVQQQIKITIGDADPAAVSEGPARFRSEDEKWLVSIGPEALSLESTDYSSWEDFRERFEALLDAVAEFLPARSTRVGLRYVNEVSVPGVQTVVEWRPLLRPEMIGLSAGEWIGPFIKRAFQQVTMQVEEDQLVLRHGFVSRDERPQPEESSMYLMDIDVFTHQPVQLTGDGVLGVLDRYHQLTWSVFRGSISDALVEKLGGEPL